MKRDDELTLELFAVIFCSDGFAVSYHFEPKSHKIASSTCTEPFIFNLRPKCLEITMLLKFLRAQGITGKFPKLS